MAMKQHFQSIFDNEDDKPSFLISAATLEGVKTHPCALWIFAENNEITRSCINRIVDNLNKLAEHGRNEV